MTISDKLSATSVKANWCYKVSARAYPHNLSVQDAFVLDLGPHLLHQGSMINPVKARLDINIQHPLIALGAEVVDPSDCVLSSPPRPNP
jgi:hypothetical protein